MNQAITTSGASASSNVGQPRYRRGLLVSASALLLAGMLFPATARAQLPSPSPDGGYPGGNTAEGDEALESVTFDAANGVGIENTAIGGAALLSNTTGRYNTAVGVFALADGNASENTAIGTFALHRNTTGTENTGLGFSVLGVNKTGNSNTAVGYGALSLSSGNDNTAIGAHGLEFNDIGSANSATGVAALQNNRTGNDNTANGRSALAQNYSGSANTAIGKETLFANTTGPYNTATGYRALYSNTTNNSTGAQGGENTANGAQSLYFNSTGVENTAVGVSALANNATGSYNIALGPSAGVNLTTGSNNIDIGNKGVAGEAAKIRIGTKGTQNGTFIAGISGVAVTGAQVVVNASGKLGVAGSSARFKEQIKPMDKASESVLALKPVTFHYKKELDPDKLPQFGLIAEEVEKVNPELVVRDDEGKALTVRYEAVNAMLLNEFLKAHRKVEEQEAGIAEMKSTLAKQEAKIAKQRKQIEALTATVEKVSDQIEANRLAPQLIANQ